MGRLDGKVCFITGTAGGQGAAAAELFAAGGATVVGCDIKLDGIDLTDPEQAADWIERGVAEAWRIDVLYNNASVSAWRGAAFTEQAAHGAAKGGVLALTRHLRASHPLGRLGEPEDVARVALFLASDDAAYLNAVDIVVDGGQSVIV
jgi:meso-butanediol dehydrogenase/(S,S)-butanediol dehydrogenase/diacetyl reductase